MRKEMAELACDEDSSIKWDIDALLEYAINTIEPIRIPALSLKPEVWVQIDKVYAMTTDTNKPIAVIEVHNDFVFTVDGNHRLYKAINSSIPELNVYYIPLENQINFINSYAPKEYNRIIKDLIKEKIFVPNIF